ncbi:MAG: DUF1667 domain-containing protein [Lachnospiraceae bacterium]|nr:DUF1667 domain-containing protein [Lachnospiraceae bacterium]
MVREFTCIMCPQGCDIMVELEEDQEKNGKILRISGNKCPKGKEYVTQEIINPMRNIATSILVEGGELPLASVRLTKPVPKARIFDVMAEIRRIHVPAPVMEGDIVLHDCLGLGSDVMVTKTVEKENFRSL